MSAAVKLRVNDRALVQNLRHAFSHSATTWILELLQNARRAGATEIRISTDEADNSFYITDDGCGISDFAKMFTLAESGWDERIRQEEGPYGLGFLSCLFAAKDVEIRSGNQVLEFSTQDLLDFSDCQISDLDHDCQGTTIILRGVQQLPDRNTVDSITSGFPIPVFFNGAELERPFSLDNMQFAKTDVGLVHLPKGHVFGKQYFLQGLPIQKNERDFGFSLLQAVHLDSRKFLGRLPDRDSLVDPLEAEGAIQAAINKLSLDLLLRKADVAASGSPEEQQAFLHRYAEEILKRHPETLNRFDFLPEHLRFGRVVEIPALNQEQESCFPKKIQRSLVESGEQIIVEDFYSHYDDEDIAFCSLFAEKEAFYLQASLDSQHWVLPHVLRDPRFICLEPLDVVGEESVSLIYRNIRVIVCRAVRVSCTCTRGDDEEVLVSAEVSDLPVYHTSQSTLYVPEKSTGTYAPDMIESYFDENEVYQEEWEQNVASAISRAVHLIRHKNYADLFKALLNDKLWIRSDAPQLCGRTFQVTVADNGDLSVVEQEAKK